MRNERALARADAGGAPNFSGTVAGIDEYNCVRRKFLAVLVCYALRWRADYAGRVSAGRGRNGASVKLDAPAEAADAADM
jgi:hypothetical protein